MTDNENFTRLRKIDLKEIFRKKNPKLADYIPGFVYSYLNRALHIRELNEFLDQNGHKLDYDFISAVIENFNVTTEIRGSEWLPENGRKIFVSNHPLGGFDGMLIMQMLIQKYGDIRTISNDILMNIHNINRLFIPINKHGGQSFDSARVLDEILRSDMPVLTFPAGLVSRRKNGVIRDVEWKKNFILKSIQYQRDVVPLHITGRCTGFFYNLANLRKFLGIKSNIEMFYLPDETFQHKNKHFVITIGKPISYKVFDKSKRPVDWALYVQDLVYQSGNKIELK